ncbi:MAG TPA: ABC transporter ATP-binding protein [Chloroflexota bacterium]|nr:ABC transporter ATP-binding protein [Chloroflexota bacterium]
MTNYILETHNLSKTFGRVTAVDQVNLQIHPGELFGFLGPNGAGKTTTIGMVLGLVAPSSGQIEMFGLPVTPNQTRPLRRVGSLVGAPALLPYLSGRDNLLLLARLADDVPDGRIDEVVARVGMSEAAGRKVQSYSTGMKQRMGLAAALLHRPDLIILDEPTNGLDPKGMREMRQLLRDLVADGVTIFLSSHLLHEVEQICDRVAVLNRGQIVAQGKVSDLLGQQQMTVKVGVASPTEAQAALQSLAGVERLSANGRYLEVGGVSGETIVRHLAQHNIYPGEVIVQRVDLESLFLEMTESV